MASSLDIAAHRARWRTPLTLDIPAHRARWRAPLTLDIPAHRARWRAPLTLALGRHARREGFQLVDEGAMHRVEDGRVVLGRQPIQSGQRSAELVQSILGHVDPFPGGGDGVADGGLGGDAAKSCGAARSVAGGGGIDASAVAVLFADVFLATDAFLAVAFFAVAFFAVAFLAATFLAPGTCLAAAAFLAAPVFLPTAFLAAPVFLPTAFLAA
ncbi:MAG: hypothetical protein M3524_12690, partial [Actinomycetota bacterium]|nr:hypothetical protein [Actinomycetota bacterium]